MIPAKTAHNRVWARMEENRNVTKINEAIDSASVRGELSVTVNVNLTLPDLDNLIRFVRHYGYEVDITGTYVTPEEYDSYDMLIQWSNPTEPVYAEDKYYA